VSSRSGDSTAGFLQMLREPEASFGNSKRNPQVRRTGGRTEDGRIRSGRRHGSFDDPFYCLVPFPGSDQPPSVYGLFRGAPPTSSPRRPNNDNGRWVK